MLGFFLKGQILANLKAMDSDWFAQNYMGRTSKVRDCKVSERHMKIKTLKLIPEIIC